MKQLLLFLLCLTVNVCGSAQSGLSLYALDHLPASAALNPAYRGDFKFALSLFPLSYQLYSNGPSYRDFVGRNESGNGGNVLRFPASKLAPGQDNLLRAESAIETFRFFYNHNSWSFNLHHASRLKGIIDYSGTLPEMAIKGNAPFIGQRIPLDTDFKLLSYEEIGIGAVYQKNNWSAGLRMKYLSGHSLLNTRKSLVSVYTDEDIYQVSLDMDLQLEVGGIAGRRLSDLNFGPIGLRFSEEEDVLVQTPEFLFDISDDLFQFSKNPGIAWDLGFNWSIDDRWELSASVLDLGKIKWKDQTGLFTAQDNYEFDGLSLGQLNFDGTDVLSFDNIQDSFDIIRFVETNPVISSRLPTQYFLNLSHQFNDQWRFGGTVFHTSFKDNNFTALSLGANCQLHSLVNLGLRYSLMNEEYFLVGLNATLQLGDFQLYALTDNVASVFRPENGRTLNARIGFAWLMGRGERLITNDSPAQLDHQSGLLPLRGL